MPDEPQLLSPDDVGKLPRWAGVAFAARCAKRVEPIYQAVWPEAYSDSRRVRAIRQRMERMGIYIQERAAAAECPPPEAAEAAAQAAATAAYAAYAAQAAADSYATALGFRAVNAAGTAAAYAAALVYWPEEPLCYFRSFRRAIEIAERAAAAAECPLDLDKAARPDAIAPRFAPNAIANFDKTEAAVTAGDAASNALDAARNAAGRSSLTSRPTFWACVDAAGAAQFLANAAGDATVKASLADYHLLRQAASREGWTDDTPVPPTFFGPLWPEGEPKDWPLPVPEAEEPAAEGEPKSLDSDE